MQQQLNHSAWLIAMEMPLNIRNFRRILGEAFKAMLNSSTWLVAMATTSVYM
jgi:hypothetical protein